MKRIQKRTMVAENRVLYAVTWFFARHGREPSQAELRQVFRISGETIVRRLKGLEARKLLTLKKFKKRGGIKLNTSAFRDEAGLDFGLDEAALLEFTNQMMQMFPPPQGSLPQVPSRRQLNEIKAMLYTVASHPNINQS